MANNNNRHVVREQQLRNQTIISVAEDRPHTATKSISRDNFYQSANYPKVILDLSVTSQFMLIWDLPASSFKKVNQNNELINVKKGKQK